MEKLLIINNDISCDIMSRVPVKSLLSLKCVSKDLHRLICDRSFIKIQMQKQQSLSGFFFQERFHWCHYDVKNNSYIPVANDGPGVKQNIFKFLPEDVVILASCNGLVCCRSCFPCKCPSIYICNPTINQWVKIELAAVDRTCSVALAFDPSQDILGDSTSFKLIKVKQHVPETDEIYFSFDLYSSRTNSWVKSSEKCQCEDSLIKNDGVFIYGTLHWLTDGDRILTFNVEEQLSWLIPVPVPRTEFLSVPVACIGEYKGLLHYVVISEIGLQVWALEDYFECKWELKQTKSLDLMQKENPLFFCNLHERVAQRYNIDIDPWVDPLSFKDGKLLMRVLAKLYLYEIETSNMKELCGLSELGANSMFCPAVIPFSMGLVPLR